MCQSQSAGSNWEISLYEVHRKPHELITDDSLIAVSPRALHAELMCPICLDLMKNTQTTKECLHRFCQECIITALRSGNKECPTCRKKLVSKRSLRPDPNFDALIAKIYPNRDELLQQQEKQHPVRPSLHCIQKRKRKLDHSSSSSSGPKTGGFSVSETPPSSRASTPQLIIPSEKRSKVTSNIDNDSVVGDSDIEDVSSTTRDDLPKIEFQLRPHPDDESVSNYIIRNLCSTPETTVAHLVKFLQIFEEDTAVTTKFNLSAIIDDNVASDNERLTDCACGNTYVNLSQSVSLRQICEKYWIPDEKLKLFFSVTATTKCDTE